MAGQLEIILVPHTHWDREWYQTFQQFRFRLVMMVNTLLDILDRDEKFSYFMLDGQTIVLDDYIAIQPQQEERLARHIRNGRILVGPWYVQPDEFLVSGESLIRNLQRGLQRAASLGRAMRVGYVPDSFGHIAQLPQILRGVGIDSAVLWRGVGAEAQANAVRWAAPDGSEVLTIHLDDVLGYSNAQQMPLNPAEFVTRTELLVANLLPKATTNTLLFMNGADHQEVQPGLPAVIEEANTRLATLDPHLQQLLSKQDGPYDSIHLQIGTLPSYIERIREQHARDGTQLQRLSGELRNCQFAPILPGTLSTRIELKQQNTATEHLLERWIEPLAAWASALGATYPEGLIAEAWRYLLQNAAHDSICGCSIDQVHVENKVRFAQSQQIGECVLEQAMRFVADNINTQAPFLAVQAANEPIPLVVFNAGPGPRTEVVQVELQLPGSLHAARIVEAQEHQGQPQARHVPYRVVNRWRQELGSMPIARELLASAVELSGVDTPEGLIQMARSMMASFAGLTDERYDLTRVYIEDISESPIRHEPHTPQPGVIYVEAMIAPKGRIAINEQELHEAGQQILNLLQRKDISTFDVSLVDQARETLEFLATDLPAYGYKTFWLYPRGLAEPTLPASIAAPYAYGSTIENEFYRVEADTHNGTVTVTDKRTSAVFTDLNRFIDGGDVGDLYNYCPPEHDTLLSEPMEPPRVEVASNPQRATLRISGRWSLPSVCTVNRKERSVRITSCTIVSEIMLTAGVQRIEIQTSVDNRVKDHRLRVLFPVPFCSEHAAAEGTFEVRQRPVRHPPPEESARWIEEPVSTFPQKRFVDVSNGEIGLAVLNRGLPEYEVVQSGPGIAEGGMAIALTLLRCVEWLSRGELSTRRGHAGPMEHTPEAQCLGQHTFAYALVPHAGSWEAQEVRVLREALAFNIPLTTRIVTAKLHAGQLPSEASLVSVEPRELVISAIKRANQGSGLVVRLYNPLPRTARGRIRLGVAFSRVSMANLLEEVMTSVPIAADAGGQSVAIELRGGEIRTLVFV
jgi:mannosylglycerate hydrolase